jgi:hypothetical protein
MVQDEITFQRETIDPIDQIGPVDSIATINVPRDIAIGWKRPAWDCKTL